MDFEKAVSFVLENEKGFVDRPADSGGATNYGISLRFLREVPSENLRRYSVFEPVTIDSIRELTQPQAKLIYRGEFWEKAPFEDLINELICTYVFDMAVCHGITQAVKLLQRSIWAMVYTRGYPKDDGILGPKTLALVNDLGGSLLPILVGTRASFYRLIAEKRPKDKENLDGWLNRCYRI